MAKTIFFPIDKSYISFNVKCIAAVGAWNPYEAGIKYWIYQIYIFYFNYVIFPVKCIADLLQTLDAHTLPQFTQAFASVIVHIAGGIKTFSIVHAQAEISLLSRLFNWERNLLCTPQMAHYRNVVISKASASSRTIALVITGIVMMNSMADLYSTLTITNCTLTDYPLSYLPLEQFSSSANCQTVALADYIVHNFATVNVIINDSFLMAVMSYITVQLKILNFRLKNCHKTFKEELVIPEKDKNIKINYYECRLMSEKQSVLDPNEELIKCIENHRKMREIFITFKSIYNNILLPQLFSSLLILSLMGCQLVLTKYDTDEDVHEMIHPIIFVTWGTLELYIYCNGGNNILVESEEISHSAYNTEWYNRDKQFRDNLSIFLALVKKPLAISIGGVVDLSAITFKNILTKAYSFMAILKNSSGK